MAEFLRAIEIILANEGGLVDDPNDGGGITNHGISYRFYKHYYPHAVHDDIRDLTVEDAKLLYKKYFWDEAPFAKIDSQRVCNGVFDAAVNCGIAPAVKMLQRAVCSVSGNADALEDDGVLGRVSIDAINECSTNALHAAFRSERAGYYRLIVANNPSQAVFIKGWLDRAYRS